MRYEYLVIPFQVAVRSGSDPEQVSNALQNVINEQAARGWEFHSLTDVNIKVTPGCLAGLFCASISYATYDQVIFRRPVQA